jgi:hypothetical protein
MLKLKAAHSLSVLIRNLFRRWSVARWREELRLKTRSRVVTGGRLAVAVGVGYLGVSQYDMIISHALTTAKNKMALNRLTKDYKETGNVDILGN